MKRFSFGNAARWGVALSAVALGVSTTSCLRGPSGAEVEPIRIGVILPLGSDLVSSREWLKGTRLAVDEVNAAGGVPQSDGPSRQVELVQYDSRQNEDRSAALAQQAIDEGAVAIIGDGYSGGALRVMGVTGPAQIPTGSCCATSTSLTNAVRALPENQRFFFRASPSDARQAYVVSDIVLDGPMNDMGLMCMRVAVLYVDNSYGMPFANGVRDELARRRPTLTTTLIPIPAAVTTSDFSTQVTALRATNANCAVLIAYPGAGAIIRDYLAESSAPPITFIGTDGIQEEELLVRTGPATFSDSRLHVYGSAPLSLFLDLNDRYATSYRPFAEEFRATYGDIPRVPYVSSSYDVTALLLLGMAHAGNTNGRDVMDGVRAVSGPNGLTQFPRQLATALRAIEEGSPINYDGASGPVDVNAEGDVEGRFEIWQVRSTSPTTAEIGRVRIFEAGDFAQ